MLHVRHSSTKILIVKMEQRNLDFEKDINFELFFNMHIDPLSIMALDGRLLKVNEAWEYTLGYNAEELEGKTLQDFIHAEDANTITEFFDSLNSGISVLNFISRYRHKNGEDLLIEWRTNKSNDVIYISASNITLIKAKEAQLVKDQQRLEAIAETQSNYVVRINFDQTFTYVNQKYQQDFGWISPNDTLVGGPSTISIYEECIEPLIETAEKCATFPNESFQIEIKHKSKNDTPIYIIWECTCLTDINGDRYEIQAIGIDITERKLNEERIKLQQEAELLEMATPITQLWDGILLLPLVGIINTQRMQSLITAVLNKITETQAKLFILDISGVDYVDKRVANDFIKLSKATRLMGCTSTLSGLSPHISQTMIDLDIQITDISTTASMKNALEIALKSQGIRLVSLK